MPSAAVYRAGEYIVRRAPAPLARAGALAAGLGVAAASRSRRRLVRRNLERVHGRSLSRREAVTQVGAVFDWYARYYVESFQLPGLDAAEVDAGFTCEGVEPLFAAAGSDAGPILVLPHLGTWEWAAWWLALIPECKVTAVVEPLEPPEVFEWFVSLRRRLGMDIIPLGPEAGPKLIAAIKRGDVVCLLSDRDVMGTGIAVDFFGEKTRLPAGPAMLALRTGAPLIPAAVYWQGPRSRHAVAMAPLDTSRTGTIRADVARLVGDYAKALESLIAAAPAQWHLMSPNWPSDYRHLGLPVPDTLADL